MADLQQPPSLEKVPHGAVPLPDLDAVSLRLLPDLNTVSDSATYMPDLDLVSESEVVKSQATATAPSLTFTRKERRLAMPPKLPNRAQNSERSATPPRKHPTPASSDEAMKLKTGGMRSATPPRVTVDLTPRTGKAANTAGGMGAGASSVQGEQHHSNDASPRVASSRRATPPRTQGAKLREPPRTGKAANTAGGIGAGASSDVQGEQQHSNDTSPSVASTRSATPPRTQGAKLREPPTGMGSLSPTTGTAASTPRCGPRPGAAKLKLPTLSSLDRVSDGVRELTGSLTQALGRKQLLTSYVDPDEAIKSGHPLGNIVVTVHSANNLLAKDISFRRGQAKTSDPFVQLRLRQDIQQKLQKRIAKETACTSTMNKTLNPVWGKENVIDLEVYDKNAVLVATVFDRDLIGHDFLGETIFELLNTITTGTKHTETFTLTDCDKNGTHSENEDQTAGLLSNPDGECDRGTLSMSFEFKPFVPPPTPLGMLEVTVVMAEGIRAADRSGTSDPYVELQAEQKGYNRRYKTPTIHKCLTPIWDTYSD